MNIIHSFWRSNFLIKLRSWEYWPFLAVYWPVFIYWIWLSLRARSFFYFSASNPGIENGGMLGESKIKILDNIPSQLKPKSIIINNDMPFEQLLTNVQEFHFPIICKPDVGERGWKVEKIKSKSSLKLYHDEMKVPYLVQEFLKEPIEMGIFYYRYPDKDHGTISSIVIKEMLKIVGDGNSTFRQLIFNYDRAKLQWKTLSQRYSKILDKVLSKGEELELVAIGNHSRGTKFLDGNHLINDQLNKVFDQISENIDGFYFGRFDIKVNSNEDLYEGNIKIMELNGAGSEPAHIYNPGYSLLNAYKAIFHHWKVLFEISVLNHRRGVPYMSLASAFSEYKKIRSVEK